MRLKTLSGAAMILAAAVMLHSPGAAAQKAYSFNVLNQRSIALTAQYWNPILTHVRHDTLSYLAEGEFKCAEDGKLAVLSRQNDGGKESVNEAPVYR